MVTFGAESFPLFLKIAVLGIYFQVGAEHSSPEFRICKKGSGWNLQGRRNTEKHARVGNISLGSGIMNVLAVIQPVEQEHGVQLEVSV